MRPARPTHKPAAGCPGPVNAGAAVGAGVAVLTDVNSGMALEMYPEPVA